MVRRIAGMEESRAKIGGWRTVLTVPHTNGIGL